MVHEVRVCVIVCVSNTELNFYLYVRECDECDKLESKGKGWFHFLAIIIIQFSLTPGKIGLAFFTGTVFYIISAPLLGKIADKIVSQITIIIPVLLE